MNTPIIIDGRNLFDLREMERLGFIYRVRPRRLIPSPFIPRSTPWPLPRCSRWLRARSPFRCLLITRRPEGTHTGGSGVLVETSRANRGRKGWSGNFREELNPRAVGDWSEVTHAYPKRPSTCRFRRLRAARRGAPAPGAVRRWNG